MDCSRLVVREGAPIRWLAAAGVVLVTAACGSGDAAPAPAVPVVVAPPRDFVSGARLRARFHRVEGVVDVLATFHDAVRDEDCAFEDEMGTHAGPNAASYCYPAGLARHREKRGPYMDAACTVPAVLTPATGPAALALVEPYDACVTAPVVRVAGASRVHGAYTSDGNGACSGAGFVSVQPLGDPLPSDAFVRAVEENEPRPGRMGVRVLVGDDGSRHVVGGFDQVRAEPVRPGTDDQRIARWLPARTAFVGAGEPLYEDAACAADAASKVARTATCPISAAVVLDGTCGLGTYFSLGAPLASVFRLDAQNACVGGPALDVLAFGLGPAIDPGAYAAVVSVDVGTALVQRRGLAVFGDQPVAWSDVVAGFSGEPCEVVPTADGTLRCLPARSEGVVLFADAACTEAAFARPIGCESGADPRFVRDAFEALPKAYEVLRQIDAVYELATRGGCVPYEPPVASRSFAVKEIDTAQFPAAVLMDE